MRDRILVIDDEPNLRKILEALLLREGFDPLCFSGFDEALPTINTEDVDAVITDLSMPGKNGMDVLEYLHHYAPDLPVIMITAFGTVEAAVSALKAGAFDFVLKPFEQADLFRTLRKALESRKRRKKEPALEAMSALGVGPVSFALFGNEPTTVALRGKVEELAKVTTPILMSGEVGTGKRTIAHEIHRRSASSQGPFVQVNCDAIPEIFQVAELFGVEKGATPLNHFTKPGYLELASGGTLFLEEIGSLGVEAQNALFTAFENDHFTRLGGAKKFPMNTRVIASASNNLIERVELNKFHVELFYKLSVDQVSLSPLRDRRKDIESHLVPLLIEKACRKNGKPLLECDPEVLAWFARQDWFGNLGELERKVNKVVNLALVKSARKIDSSMLILH